MVADDDCFPSVKLIEAEIIKGDTEQLLPRFEHNTKIQRSKRHCHIFSYILIGGLELSVVNIQFRVQEQGFSPATLTVQFKGCPTGYKTIAESGKCACLNILKLFDIQCNQDQMSLIIPAQTWMGELGEESGSVAMKKDCQYCKTEETEITADIARYSHKICTSNRIGVMCGACFSNYSLQLGGYENV